MKAGSFTINGVTSESLKAVIQSRPLIETPIRRVGMRQQYGQNGSILYDEKAYDNTVLSLILAAYGPDAKVSREQIYKAFDSGEYQDLIMYFDPTKIYKVLTTTPPKFESRVYFGEVMPFSIDFTVKPFKHLVTSPMSTITVKGSTITNPTLYNSLPEIIVYGSGDVTLTVNGINYVIKGIDSYIKLDCEALFAYKDTSGIITSENAKIYFRDYPTLKPGANTVTWTGTVTKIEIIPKWRSLT